MAAALCFVHNAHAVEALKSPLHPLAFEPNRGQTDASVAFLAHGPGYALYLRPAEAVFSLKTSKTGAFKVLRMRLLGAAKPSALSGAAPLPGRHNYYIGNDPGRWRTGVSTYREVRESGVYPGIDLIYHGRRGRLEYDFIVAPGAAPEAVRLAFDGADALRIDDDGDLILRVGDAQLVHHAPVAYQMIGGAKVPVAARYVRRGSQVAFALGDYDKRRPLTIDPALNYSSYLGGSGSDQGRAVAVDSSGNIYITGATQSLDFPGATGTQSGGTDAFVTKLNSDGSIAFSTYLGSSGTNEPSTSPGIEMGDGIALDGQGNIYVTGGTAGSVTSTGFPTKNAYQSCSINDGDAFVSVLDGTGKLSYSTCIGGSVFEAGMGIAVDGAGRAYVAGWTNSGASGTTPFPTKNAILATGSSNTNIRDGFFFVLDPSKTGTSQLLYSTYIGTTTTSFHNTYAYAVALDSKGMAYVAGETECHQGDFLALPATNRYQPDNSGGKDAFVLKIDPTASGANALKQGSTFFGGSLDDSAYGIAVLAPDIVIIAGGTASSDLPFKNAYDPALKGSADGFVAKFNFASSAPLVYSTYLGGSDKDVINGIAVDSIGRAYVTGATTSIDFPAQPAVSSLTKGGGNSLRDAFVTSVDGTGATLNYSGYLGGTGDDAGMGITLGANNTAYVVGGTNSTDFPTQTPQQAQPSGEDAFIAEVGVAADLSVAVKGGGTPLTLQPYTYHVMITNAGPDVATGVSLKLQIRLKSNGFPTSGLGDKPNDQFGNCTYDGPTATLTCPMGAIQPNLNTPTTADISGTYSVSATQTVVITATVSADETDRNPSNNTDHIDSTAGVAPKSTSSPASGSGAIGAWTIGILLIAIALKARATRRGAPVPEARRRADRVQGRFPILTTETAHGSGGRRRARMAEAQTVRRVDTVGLRLWPGARE